MEKIKDILYDLSDIVISLVIIAIIFGVVSWKLNEAMPIDMALVEATETSELSTLETQAQSVTIEDDDAGTPRDQVSSETEVIEITTAPEVITVDVTIPSGSSGNKIAALLKDKQLIEDDKEFLKVVAKLGIGSRLQAGKFTLSSDMSYQEMAKILAGQ